MKESNAPLLGLVTVLYKSDDVLPDFFDSLARQQYNNYHLFLIDNSYSEATKAIVDRYTAGKKNIHHIDAGGNVGVAAGNNLGIRAALAAGCQYTVLLNNDIHIAQTDCFENLLRDMEAARAQMAVPKILYYNTNLIWMAGGKMDNWRALGVHAGYNAPNKGFDTIEPITYAPTCFMLIDHAVFDRIGIMDEKYFVYCDDTDFVYRAIQQGFKMIYTPHVVIDHKVSVSTGGDNSSFYIYYSNRNKIYFIRKHYRLLRKWIALAYMLLARFFFYLKFDKAQKQKLVQGIRDGWKMQIEKV